MIILNAGVPRSGTIWAFNAFREIWSCTQKPFEVINLNSTSQVEDYLSNKENLHPSQNKILHFHEFTPALRQVTQRSDVRLFVNYRDPRDVTVSQMRLHDVSFEQAIAMTQAAYRNFSEMITLPLAMLIPYDHIQEHAPALVFQMAMRVDIFLNLENVRKIVDQISIARHQKIMDAVNQTDATDETGNVATVNLSTRTIRFDRERFITDRHIQSGKSGRWKNELNESQQAVANHTFEALVTRLGFQSPAAA